MATKPQKLNKRMLIAIEAEIAHPEWPDEFIANEAKVNTTTVRVWHMTDCYKDELARRLKEVWNGNVKKAQTRLIDLLDSENATVAFNAAKYMLDSASYNAPQKVEINGDTGLNISINYGD